VELDQFPDLFETTWHYCCEEGSIARVARDVLASFAENLRRLRQAAGISQEELGSRAGIQMADISRYEGAHRDPRVTTVARLADALDSSVCELLETRRK